MSADSDHASISTRPPSQHYPRESPSMALHSLGDVQQVVAGFMPWSVSKALSFASTICSQRHGVTELLTAMVRAGAFPASDSSFA
eukprot:14731113-Alexandrium_andersonii.AAC.1